MNRVIRLNIRYEHEANVHPLIESFPNLSNCVRKLGVVFHRRLHVLITAGYFIRNVGSTKDPGQDRKRRQFRGKISESESCGNQSMNTADSESVKKRSDIGWRIKHTLSRIRICYRTRRFPTAALRVLNTTGYFIRNVGSTRDLDPGSQAKAYNVQIDIFNGLHNSEEKSARASHAGINQGIPMSSNNLSTLISSLLPREKLNVSEETLRYRLTWTSATG
ncbi:hypothetical protein B0H11DRAFT_1914006 [Mycena galericulata]|nr:hypothetical protein B0H11DRAFT_1914006 [Mycena galericulata]